MVECLETEGIIMHTIPHGETSLIIDVFTYHFGMIKGYVRGGRQKKNSGIYQKGTLIALSHQRRLFEQLGQITADVIDCYWVDISRYKINFKIFDTLSNLLLVTLPQFVPETLLYKEFLNFIKILKEYDNKVMIQRYYADYLILCLQQLGYLPDFTSCAVSGSRKDVIYVSPKTARAISVDIAGDYASRLLPLPAFLKNYALEASEEDICNSLKILQLCFKKFVFEPKNTKIVTLLI